MTKLEFPEPEGLISSLLCHTHAVERLIKTVIESSTNVVGEQSRDGVLHSRLHSRLKIPKFVSKREGME